MVKYIIVPYLMFSGMASYSQDAKPENADVTVSVKVYGVCGQCKERIEEAVKGKGVKSAVWNENTQMLSLVYNPSKASLEKLKNKIVAVGHDVEDKKANIAVYESLPKCCLYREPGANTNHSISEVTTVVDSLLINTKNINPQDSKDFIQGVVLEENSKGGLAPV